MYILILLIALLLLILVLLAEFPLKVVFAYNSDQLNEPYALISWINPFLKGTLERKNDINTLTVYLFNKQISSVKLKYKKQSLKNAFNLVKSIKAHFIKLQAYYGFEDPSVTGMVCGVVNMIPEYLEVDTLNNNPDFVTDFDYFNIHGMVEIHILTSLKSLRKLNRKPFYPEALYSNK